MNKVADRLYLDSCRRKPKKYVVDSKKMEEEKWEKVLYATHKLNVHSAPVRTTRAGSSLNTMGAILSTVPPPCYFQSFPKEKVRKSQNSLYHFEIPTKTFAKSLKSLTPKSNSPRRTNFSANGVEPYPMPEEKNYTLYKPISATCNAFDTLHP